MVRNHCRAQVLREASAALDDDAEKKKRGKALGVGHILFTSAEQAKNFIFRFNGFPVGAGVLKVRLAKQALSGSLSFRNKKMTAHDRKLKALRQEEKGRVRDEKDAFAAMQQVATRPSSTS